MVLSTTQNLFVLKHKSNGVRYRSTATKLLQAKGESKIYILKVAFLGGHLFDHIRGDRDFWPKIKITPDVNSGRSLKNIAPQGKNPSYQNMSKVISDARS